MTDPVHALPRALSLPRALRPRRVSTPLPAVVAEQIQASFYAPVLSGTHLAESLLRAGRTDAELMRSAEWRGTLQQAMSQIQASCAAWHDLSSSEAAQQAFPPILACVDELERFLRLSTPLLGDMEPEVQRRQLELSDRVLAQSSRALEQIYRTILHPTGRKPAAKKPAPVRAPDRLSATLEKRVRFPGWPDTRLPGRHREMAPLASAPTVSPPTAPLPALPSDALDSPPADLASPALEPASRSMTDGLRLLSNSGQWIEQAVGCDTRIKSENTQREYIADLYVFNAWRRERPFTRALVQDYAATLERTSYSPDAIAHTLEALRWLAGRLADLAMENDHLDAEEQQDILISAAQVIGFRQARGVAPAQDPGIAKAELAALLQHCAQDVSWLGARDAAIVALAWSTNLRPSQLAGLKVTSVQCDSGGVSVIVRRGIKDETISLPEPVMQAVIKWLSVRRYDEGPLFHADSRPDNIRSGQAMSEAAVVQAIKTRMIAAQIASALPPDH